MSRRWFISGEKADELEQKLNEAESLEQVKSVVSGLIFELRWTELSDILPPDKVEY